MPKYTNTKYTIVALYKQGFTQMQIARRLNVSKQYVNKIVMSRCQAELQSARAAHTRTIAERKQKVQQLTGKKTQRQIAAMLGTTQSRVSQLKHS